MIFTFRLAQQYVIYCMSETLQCHQQSLGKTFLPLAFVAVALCLFTAEGTKGTSLKTSDTVEHLGHLFRREMALFHRFFPGLGEECLVELKSYLSQIEIKCKKA